MAAPHPFTSDFHQQFEAETASLLRRRFLWFTGLAGGIGILILAISVVLLVLQLTGESMTNISPTQILTELGSQAVRYALTTALYAVFFVKVWKHRPRKDQILSMSYWAIVVTGVLYIVQTAVLVFLFHQKGKSLFWPGMAIFSILPAHLVGAALLPWSPREAARPGTPLVILNTIYVILLPGAGIWTKVLLIILGGLVIFPGTFIAWLKHNRRMSTFKVRFLQSRYGEIRRELVDARRIHEALFPRPITTGPIRFNYHYEPMQLIGGDYLYARTVRSTMAEGSMGHAGFNLLLIDVTGHGIAAALTVNRLFGEVERLYAEDPDARPGDVLRALNRYVHLTLATHSIYATALCLRIDQARGMVEFASGGHPPAFLRAVDGTLDELKSTSFVLGACADADFDPAPERRLFGPGDTLVAYTDGAIEAMNEQGRFLGVAGIQRVVAASMARGHGDSPHDSAVGGLVRRIMQAVEEHRTGPPRDDTIVVEISRPLVDDEPPAHKRDAARASSGRQPVGAA